MLFRIVAPHCHRAVVGAETFMCVRQAVANESGIKITWSAYRGDVLLLSDCPTLNDAKKICRAAASRPAT